VLEFGIAINVTAGLGAFGLAWVDDWIGAKRTLIISLASLIAVGAAILVVEDKAWFWALGLVIGVFMGPTQAASRSLMARLAPPGMTTEMFGLFALSGKATAFIGPWLVGVLTVASGSQRVGMASILVFFAVGLAILLGVREPGRDARPQPT
jgi:UMF1 family MFS transporter